MTGRLGVIIWTGGLVAFAAVTLYQYDPTILSRIQEQCPFVKTWLDKTYSLLGFDDSDGGADAGATPGETGSLKDGARLMTSRQLADYGGQPGSKGLMLAILGKIYDVKRGAQHYGPGGPYQHFSGRDATRSFITGETAPEALTDDVSNLSQEDIAQLETWTKFYEEEYTYVGRLIGRYYDNQGNPTEALNAVHRSIQEGHAKRRRQEEEREQFPGCNSEWVEGKGGRVWCTTQSGGVARSWVGLPRQLYYPGTGETRCVCVHKNDLEHPNIREFPDCPPSEPTCPLPGSAT